jgi:hypothetical protein
MDMCAIKSVLHQHHHHQIHSDLHPCTLPDRGNQAIAEKMCDLLEFLTNEVIINLLKLMRIYSYYFLFLKCLIHFIVKQQGCGQPLAKCE